jgi:hypothetical protein
MKKNKKKGCKHKKYTYLCCVYSDKNKALKRQREFTFNKINSNNEY